MKRLYVEEIEKINHNPHRKYFANSLFYNPRYRAQEFFKDLRNLPAPCAWFFMKPEMHIMFAVWGQGSKIQLNYGLKDTLEMNYGYIYDIAQDFYFEKEKIKLYVDTKDEKIYQECKQVSDIEESMTLELNLTQPNYDYVGLLLKYMAKDIEEMQQICKQQKSYTPFWYYRSNKVLKSISSHLLHRLNYLPIFELNFVFSVRCFYYKIHSSNSLGQTFKSISYMRTYRFRFLKKYSKYINICRKKYDDLIWFYNQLDKIFIYLNHKLKSWGMKIDWKSNHYAFGKNFDQDGFLMFGNSRIRKTKDHNIPSRITTLTLKKCSNCMAIYKKKNKKCSRCWKYRKVNVYYCSEICQATHWKKHQQECINV